MQDIVLATDALRGLHIGAVNHAHHETFRRGVRRHRAALDAAVEYSFNIVQSIKPVGGHGQRIADKKPPEGIADALLNSRDDSGDHLKTLSAKSSVGRKTCVKPDATELKIRLTRSMSTVCLNSPAGAAPAIPCHAA